jgi:hypothetical protein
MPAPAGAYLKQPTAQRRNFLPGVAACIGWHRFYLNKSTANSIKVYLLD